MSAAPGSEPVTREECERHRHRCDDHLDRTVRDIRAEIAQKGEDLRVEIERRDSERKADHQTLISWMVRVESKVNGLPREFQDAIDKRFERIFQLLVGLILSILVAGVLAYLGIRGGPF